MSDNQEIILSVRPFQGLKEMPDGTVVKTFAKTEVEVPIVAAMWAPRQTDPRLSNIPARLEKDPYKYANARGSVSSKPNGKQSKSSKSASSKVANSDESLSEVLLTPVEDTSGEKTHWAAPYEDFSVLPGYEKQNGNASTVNGSSVKDVMNGSKRGKKSKRKKRQENASVEDILPLSPSHDEAWLPLDDTEVPTKKLEAWVTPRSTNTSFGTATENSSQPSSSSVSQYGLESDPTAGLPDEIRVVNATGRKWWEQPPKPDSSSSRSFSTASLTRAGVRKPTMFQNSFHKLQTSRSTRSFATGTFRTRAVVTLGVAAATFFFAPLTEAALFELNTRQLPVLSHNLNGIASSIDVRGGDQDLFGEVRDNERSRSPPPLEFDHGTTTLSFTFQGGAIVAVDSRASQGNFVGSKTVQKVLPINS